MSALLLLDNEPIPFPSTLVDTFHVLVYLHTDERFLIQLNSNCSPLVDCGRDENTLGVEL
jgi:hypothetical protein